MSRSRIIMVTSCKGGVGKSTVAANLSVCLAYGGSKTLVIDCDFGVRSLDLIMGLENEVIYDISDVVLRGVRPEKAFVSDPRSEKLFFCAAPYSNCDEMTENAFSDAIDDISENMGFDYIIIDTPGDTGLPFHLAASVSDMALVISTCQPTSIRAAERTAIMLGELGVENRRLIINSYNPKDNEYCEQPGLLEVIDKTSIQLIGIIPYDRKLAALQANGISVIGQEKSNSAVAFENIRSRLNSRNVPLFTGFKKVKRSYLLHDIN